MHPSLIAGEDHNEFALEGSNHELEAMFVAIEDIDTTLAILLVGRVSINNMSVWCLVDVFFGPCDPDITFAVYIEEFSSNCATD